MGSASDLDVMKQAADFLEEMHIPFEMYIISAHRTPHLIEEYASTLKKRGVKVVIAGAGGAAHLPGENGVINLLRKKGFIVEPVPFEFKDEE
jgi:5-(carboxyamino)imidazole ribonucleotide mutase